jgi:hypothetical protein
MDEPTGSCTAGEGVCCLDAEGGTCSCYTSITACLEGDEVVSSCSVESLSCGSSTEVSACN